MNWLTKVVKSLLSSRVGGGFFSLGELAFMKIFTLLALSVTSLLFAGCVVLDTSLYECDFAIQNIKASPECIAILPEIAKEYGFNLTYNKNGNIQYKISRNEPSPIGYESSKSSPSNSLTIGYNKKFGEIYIYQGKRGNKTAFTDIIEKKIEAMLDAIIGKNGYIKKERKSTYYTIG